jgi:hypothetical protein
MAKSKPIQVGDRVEFRSSWCKSVGAIAGAIPHAKGIVVGIVALGSSGPNVVEVDWGGDPEVPPRSIDRNLKRVGELEPN